MPNGKVLIIDDDTDILQVIRLILTKNGFEAVTFSSPPPNFVEEVSGFNPRVILLDVQLGGYDGRVLGKQIKKVENLAHIPVILFSANNHFRQDITAYKCDDFIDKSFEVVFLEIK